jgi:hypothetical protein
VKLLFAIPFVFVMLLQSLHVSVGDIVKIPTLVEHFQEHQELYGDGVLSFLNKHYGADKEEHNSEDSEHGNLPFHHSQHVCVDIRMDIPPSFTLKTPQPDQSKHYFVYHEPHSTKRAYTIHQPPKKNC